MALRVVGELLSATIETVQGKERSFESRKLTVFGDGEPTVVMAGDRFPTSEFLALRDEASNRPQVELSVSIFNGRLYLNRIISAGVPA